MSVVTLRADQPGRGFKVSIEEPQSDNPDILTLRFTRFPGSQADAYEVYKAYTAALTCSRYALSNKVTSPISDTDSFIIPIELPQRVPTTAITQALQADLPRYELGANFESAGRRL